MASTPASGIDDGTGAGPKRSGSYDARVQSVDVSDSDEVYLCVEQQILPKGLDIVGIMVSFFPLSETLEYGGKQNSKINKFTRQPKQYLRRHASTRGNIANVSVTILRAAKTRECKSYPTVQILISEFTAVDTVGHLERCLTRQLSFPRFNYDAAELLEMILSFSRGYQISLQLATPR